MLTRDWVNKNKEFFTGRDIRYAVKIISQGKDVLDSRQEIILNELTEAYKKGLPVAYALNKEEFMGKEFMVTSDVLIPRPETELIVEAVIGNIGNRVCDVLDMCCGCGVIGISVKTALPRARVIGVDISEKALNIARCNSQIHRQDIVFIHSDLFAAIVDKKFDCIVCNPPYVSSACIIGSLIYEPKIALDGGLCGMDIISSFIAQSFKYLNFGGYVVLEIGYDQKEKVQACIEQANAYEVIEWLKDYAGHWRGVVLKLKAV